MFLVLICSNGKFSIFNQFYIVGLNIMKPASAHPVSLTAFNGIKSAMGAPWFGSAMGAPWFGRSWHDKQTTFLNR